MRQEALIGCTVVLLAAGVLGIFALRQGQKTGLLTEASRMRRIYVAISEYESGNDTQPAPNLPAASMYMSMPSDFATERDPYAPASGPFPIDGSLPTGPLTSKVRISDAYVMTHALAGKVKLGAWAEYRVNLAAPVLASEWFGKTEAGGNFNATVTGDLLRIQTDGSVKVVHRSETVPLGDRSLWAVRP